MKLKGAMQDLQPDLVMQVDDRGIFSAATEPNWTDAVILELLKHQFTCMILHNKSHTFRFYSGNGDTWRFKP